MITRDRIADAIDDDLNKLLGTLMDAEGITTGDIEPMQTLQWDKHVNELSALFLQLLEQNSPLITLAHVRMHEGRKMKIYGQEFKLYIEHDCAGDWAVWSSELYTCYATPNYEREAGVPVDIRPKDEPCLVLDTAEVDIQICSFDEYCQVVRELIEDLLKTEAVNSVSQNVEPEATL